MVAARTKSCFETLRRGETLSWTGINSSTIDQIGEGRLEAEVVLPQYIRPRPIGPGPLLSNLGRGVCVFRPRRRRGEKTPVYPT